MPLLEATADDVRTAEDAAFAAAFVRAEGRGGASGGPDRDNDSDG